MTDNCTTFDGIKYFCGMKAKDTNIPEAGNIKAIETFPKSMSCIIDYFQIVFLGKDLYSLNITNMTVYMNR